MMPAPPSRIKPCQESDQTLAHSPVKVSVSEKYSVPLNIVMIRAEKDSPALNIPLLKKIAVKAKKIAARITKIKPISTLYYTTIFP